MAAGGWWLVDEHELFRPAGEGSRGRPRLPASTDHHPPASRPERNPMTRLRLAVVGVGHLGKEHARILAALPEVELVGVADPNAEQAGAVAQRCGTAAYGDHRALLGQ